jgi:hypothetical protein
VPCLVLARAAVLAIQALWYGQRLLAVEEFGGESA